MFRLHFTGLALILSVLNAEAQTVIPGGNVSGVWTASGSPYLIEGEIVVSSTDTLIIQPAVEVIFQSHDKFIIHGRLEAIGTENDSILFTAEYAAAGWHSLRFIDTPENSTLEYCIIEYGWAYGLDYDGFGGGIFVFNSSLILNHCTVRSNHSQFNGGGICMDGSFADFQNCEIIGNECENFGSNSKGGGLHARESTCNLIDCLFADNSALGTFGGGGGFSYDYHSDGLISGCEIHNNSVPLASGGGFHISWSDPEIEYCSVSGNSCEDGGSGAYLQNYTSTLHECEFLSNYTEGDGAVYLDYCSCIVSETTIASNTSERWGGGLEIMGGAPTIQDCIIESNTSLLTGGGIHINTSANPIIDGCSILNNNAADIGGGIYCSNGTFLLSNSTISNNVAGNEGGGILRTHYTFSVPDSIYNCTITGNSALNGAGLCFYGGTVPTLINSIIAYNENGSGIHFGNEGEGIFAFCDFFDNQCGNFSGMIPTGLGVIVTTNINGDSCDIYQNIFDDPLFEDPVAGNYQITWENWPINDETRSPCIDAGNPASIADPDSTISDIGALYFHQPRPVTIELVPLLAAIQIPSQGGSFEFYLFATNNDSITVNADIWIEVILPDGTIHEVLTSPVNIDFNPGMTGWYRVQNVPQMAPGGDYKYIGKIGLFPGHWDADTLEFEKLEMGEGTAISNWDVWGDSFIAEASRTTDIIYTGMHSLVILPNPFNPSTVISYQLSAISHVNLAVYDISGRKVTELVKGWRNAGLHEVMFDGSDLSSGIYIYRLEMSGSGATPNIVSGKMVLVK